ncbi:alpha/beta hydrolase [Actinoallomurus sp. CA-142502]|uniref:alpha/beta hydrolase n=1 Tax=Actinoallomurus sp. CA-142502 TaxID=3239885 RepID=UPI003D938818
MRGFTKRQQVRFVSDDAECAAWHYAGDNGACVVMAAGFGVTKEPGTDRFAARFQEAGFSVLAFDHRGFGDSGGGPRQVVRMREQLADWNAAIAHAATLPGVNPDRIAAWGFSLAGGHIIRVAADHPSLAAAVAQTPTVDGVATTLSAGRYQRPTAALRLLGRAVRDAVGGRVGRPPVLVPLAGEPGTVSALTTPDGKQGPRALDPDGRYPEWQMAVAARSTLILGGYRPVRQASRVRCPLLVVAGDSDRSAPPKAAIRTAERAPRGELVRLKGGHYAPFLDEHEKVVSAELEFLRRHLLGEDAQAEATAAEPGMV